MIREPYPHRPFCALDPIGLGAARVEIGNQCFVRDELAAHRRRLAVVQDLRGGALAEVVLPGLGGHGVEDVVDHVGAQWN
jgi:hypothetical protein